MPSHLRDDKKPVVQFDPRLEVSPFLVFRRLKDGRPPPLIDVRPRPGALSLQGAEKLEPDWRPSGPEEEAIFFDDDGSQAIEIVKQLQEEGYSRVRALFGGLQLWQFALDPQVVGDETFLVLVREEAQNKGTDT